MKIKVIITTFLLIITFSNAQTNVYTEPYSEFGLILDTKHSYIEKLTLNKTAFLDPEPRELFARIHNLYEKLSTPYTNHFPVIWQDENDILQIIQVSEKIPIHNGNDIHFQQSKPIAFYWQTATNEMYRLHLKWFDATTNAYYQSQVLINSTKLYALNRDHFAKYGFNQLFINLEAGGKFSLWLKSPSNFYSQFSYHLKAPLIEEEWQQFKENLTDETLKTLSQQEYADFINQREENPYPSLNFRLINQDDIPADNFPYYIVRDDGKLTYCGITNEEGLTKTLFSDEPAVFHSYDDTSECPRIKKRDYSNNYYYP